MKNLLCIVLLSVVGCHSGAIYFKPHPKPPVPGPQVYQPPTTTKHVSCIGDLNSVDTNFTSQPYNYKATFNTDGSTDVSLIMGCSCGNKETTANYEAGDSNAKDGYVSTTIGKYVLEKYEFTVELNSLTLNVLFDDKYNLEITNVCTVD